jgi:iron complex outermembrane receptor protein
MASMTTFPCGLVLLAAATAGTAQTQEPPREAELPRVTVTDRPPSRMAEPAPIAEFDDGPLGQLPMTVNVITARDLRESGARSLSSAVRGIAGVGDSYNTTGYIETLQIRGLLLDNFLNYRRNGLPVSNYMPFAPENKESVQILMGTAGFLAGTASPGGMIDYVIKRPAATSVREVSAEIADRGTWLLTADLSERTGAFGYRFNVAAEERRPYANDAPGDRLFAAGAFDLKLPRDGILEFEVEWQRSRQISVPGLGLLDTNGDGVAETLPPPLDPRINLNNQPWSLPFESRAVTGTVRYEQAISEVWRAGVRALAQRIVTNDRIAFPDGCSTGPTYVYPGLCGNYDVDIYDFRSNDERRSVRATEAYAIARFPTGPVSHRVQFGARATRYSERFPPLQAYNFVGTTNVFAQVDLPEDPSLTVLNSNRDVALDEVYVYDVLWFGPKWSTSFAARYVNVDNRSALSDGSESVAFEQSLVLPWAAVRWLPWEGGLFALSWGTDVEAEAVPNRPLDFANPGQALPATRSRQVEFVFRQVWADGDSISVALFDIRKPYSADVPQPSGPPLRVADGRTAQHRGIELGLVQAPVRSLLVNLQAAFLDAKNISSIDPALVDKRVTNVPEFAASATVDWRPTDAADVRWRNRVGYVGSKEVLSDNSVSLPASWQWDTALFWSPAGSNPRLQFRLGVDNVTDRRYWREAPTQPWGATYIFPAQPRTYRVGMTAQW